MATTTPRAWRIVTWWTEGGYEKPQAANSKNRVKGPMKFHKEPRLYGTLAFNRILAHPRGAEINLAFDLMKQYTAGLAEELRGWLVRQVGQKVLPMTAQDLSDETGYCVDAFNLACEVLSTERIGWLTYDELILDSVSSTGDELPLLDDTTTALLSRDSLGAPGSSTDSLGALGSSTDSPAAQKELPPPLHRTAPSSHSTPQHPGPVTGASAPRGDERRGPARPTAVPSWADARPIAEQLVPNRNAQQERGYVLRLPPRERVPYMAGVLSRASPPDVWAECARVYAGMVCDSSRFPAWSANIDDLKAMLSEASGREDRADIAAGLIAKLLEVYRWIADGKTGNLWGIVRGDFNRRVYPDLVASRSTS